MKIQKFNEELYQSSTLRNENGLIYKMRDLFNKEELTTWEYNTFIKLVIEYAKSNDLYFDEKKEILYKN